VSYKHVFAQLAVEMNPTTEELAAKMQTLYPSIEDASEVVNLLTTASEAGKTEEAVQVLEAATEECLLEPEGTHKARSAILKERCHQAIAGWN
jgi:pyocin large subunit-like protein